MRIVVVGTRRLYNDLHTFDYYMSEGDKYFGSMVSCSTWGLRVIHRSPHRHRERLGLMRLHSDMRGLVEILVGEVGGRWRVRNNVGLLLLLLLLLLACSTESARPFANQALMLATGKECETKGAMFAAVLVVIPKTVHVFVPSWTITDTTSVGTEPLLDFPDLTIAHAFLQHLAFLAGGEVT